MFRKRSLRKTKNGRPSFYGSFYAKPNFDKIDFILLVLFKNEKP